MDAPWMDIAEAELGTRGLPGAKNNNPRVLEYLSCVGSATTDETAWCSGFVNWVMKKTGIKGTGNALARSWLPWGARIVWPEYGSVAVFWREQREGWKGHVGFYTGHSGNNLFILGGNQGNTPGVVSVTTIPKARLLGYRWPSSQPASGDSAAGITISTVEIR
jgi:uncharacterized protein (TIGR02594 family)